MSVRNETTDRELAEYIITHTETHGYPPSRQQMAAHFGWASKNAAQQRLERLILAGVIERTPGVTRGIKVNRQRLNEFGGK